jgi:hypothetical protein
MDKYKHSGSQPKTTNVEAASNSKALKYGYREVKTRKKQINKIPKSSCEKEAGFSNFQHTTLYGVLDGGVTGRNDNFWGKTPKNI